MNKWFNKQKPLTLAFITAVTCFIITFGFSFYIEISINTGQIFKLSSAIGFLVFCLSFLMFRQIDSSLKVFDEIESLYFRAKKVKTKTEMIIVESDYRILRKKCQHQGHYAKMNEIWQIIETKKEFL